VVRTDHAALVWLRRTPELIGQQARWMETMEEFDFHVVHRAGSRHGNADALSRRPCRSQKCACRDPEYAVGCRRTVEMQCGGQSGEPPTIPTPSLGLGWDSADIAAEQRRDADIVPIIKLKGKHVDRPSWHQIASGSDVSKQLRGQWVRLELRDGVLCRRFENTQQLFCHDQIVLPRVYRRVFFKIAHTGTTGGHLGRRRTAEQIQRRAYWPGWTTDVRMYMKQCDECALYHRGHAPRLAEMTPIPSGEPWETVSVDITGPHPKSRRGNIYIVTLMDHFSKWAEAIAVRNHTAPVVARVLLDNVFTRFGMPLRLLTDCGPEFESCLFQEMCRWMGIDKIRTTPYRPSTNGVLERFHRTLNAMLAKVVRQDQRDWCERLQSVMCAYRSSIHEVTGYTPNLLFLGRENRAPLDLVIGPPPGETPHYVSADDFVAGCQERTREAYEHVRH